MSERMLGAPLSAELQRFIAMGLLRQGEATEPEKRQLRAGTSDQGWLLWKHKRQSGGLGGPPRRGADGIRVWLRSAWRRYRSRQDIARLDAHALRDIGVTYAEAEAEANKPFWRE